MLNSFCNNIKKVWRWFTAGEYILAEICCFFTVITVVNSCMMVFHIDTPKVGEFAYIHLLSRLLIISVIVIIIEFIDGENILQEIRRIIQNIKSVKKLSVVLQNIVENKFSTICVAFTSLTAMNCFFMILFANGPMGGVDLYTNLLILFGVLTAIITIVYLLSKALITHE